MFKLRFVSQARKEANEAQEYYESQQEGLGAKFAQDFDKSMTLLQSNPEMYAKFLDEVRKGKMTKFPYSFYYKENMPKEMITMLAVFAQARDPKQIAKILEKRMDELD